MRYLDTSLLVAAFTLEVATERALAFLRSSRNEPFMISEWVSAEFAGAMSLKIRTKEIDERYRAEAATLFARSVAASMIVVDVTALHFKAAAKFASEHKLGLRAGDALHLAIASDRGATLCTMDKLLARAGRALGARTELV